MPLRSAQTAITGLVRGPWLRRVLYAATDQGSFAGANFVVNVLLARWLAPEGYGAYTVAYTLFLLVGVVHAGMLAEPMLVFGSGRFASRFGAYLRVVLAGHLRFSLAAGVLLGALAVAAWASGQVVLGHALAVFAVGQSAILFQWAMRSACYTQHRSRVAATAGLIYAGTMIASVWGLKATGWLNEVTGIALMSAASLVAGLFIMWRLGIPWRRVHDPALAQEARERHRQYGGWAVGTGVLEWFHGFLPFLLLPLWAGLGETGALRALFNLVLPILHLFRGFAGLLVPAFVQATASGSARRLVRSIGLGLGGATVVFAALVFVFGPEALHLLYDGQYDGYAHLLWMVAVLPLVLVVSNVGQAVLRAQERPEAVFAARSAAAGVAATLGAASTFVFGVAGALASDLVSATAEAAVMVSLIRRGAARILESGGHAAGRGPDPSRRHVLVAAFACEPGRGSEPGQGWQVASRLAAHHDVTAVVYAGFRPAIEAYLARTPVPGLRVAYYRLPFEPARHHAAGEPWSGFAEQFHYIAWTLGARGLVRRLYDASPFDAAVHASFMRYWSPSPAAALVGVPFVWGPVGGGETAPPAFVAAMPWRGRLRARLRQTIRAASHALPPVRTTARRATLALATTPESARRMERLGARAVEVARASVALEQAEAVRLGALPPPPDGPLTFLFTGRLLDWKGVDLGLRAFARACAASATAAVPGGAPDALAGARFVVLGEGPERARLEALAASLGVTAEFRGNRPRPEALATLAHAHVQVHPSLHDSGGYATLEALAAGRPVVCLDLGGPAVQVRVDAGEPEVGVAVAARTPEEAVAGMAAAFVRLARDPALRARMGHAAKVRVAERFVWESVAADLAARLDALLATAAEPLDAAAPAGDGSANGVASLAGALQ